LDEAIPALEAAARALNSIKQGDIAELRTLKVFHADVQRVFCGVLVLMGKSAIREMN